MYIARTLMAALERASATFPAVLVTGPRQVGKTTLLEHAAEQGRRYVSLDSPTIRSLARNDPELFFQTYSPPLLIDEVQYAPGLFPFIKMIADRQKKNGLFWMTGSQQFQLMKHVSESLAGRVAILDLLGLSQAEKAGRPDTPPFHPENTAAPSAPPPTLRGVYALIQKGSYPALYADPKLDGETFYSSYIRTYLERDVHDLLNVSNEATFVNFMRAVAARTGQLLNYADLSRDLGVSQNTVKAWLSVLQTSGIVYLLQPYAKNLTSRLIKSPKLYFLDTGLCCYLTGWNTPETLEAGAMSGALLETYVVSEIIKSYWHNGMRPWLSFYRDKNACEIDLLIEKNGVLHPIEIKKTAAPRGTDIRHFAALKNHGLSTGHGAVICFVPQRLPMNRDVDMIPVGLL